MGRFFKWVFGLAFAAGLLYAASYAGAWLRVGQLLGSPAPEMGVRTVRFQWGGVPDLPSHPRGWEFQYSRASVNGNRPAKVFVSPGGRILGTIPRDLDRRIEVWHRSKEIQ